MAVSEAMENYLETILILSRSEKEVHAVDICKYLGYSRPTVSVVVHRLSARGYLTIDAMNHIALTPRGTEIAERIYERHNVLAELLQDLGVDRDIALKDACKIEHDLSPETFECIRKYHRKRNT